MPKRLLIILAIVLSLSACTKKQKEELPASDLPPGSLNVFAIEQFRTSGLEAIIHKEFGQRYNCSFNTTIFRTAPDLLEAISADSVEVDVVVGIPGSFAYRDSLQEGLLSIRNFLVTTFDQELDHKPGDKLIPYGFGKLAIVYNEKQIEVPPSTFGDLQDARYISQMAIPDPKHSGMGRAILHWSLALFGENGYQMLWRSLRKNIGKQFDCSEDAVTAFREGRYAMILATNATAIWLKEQDRSLDYFKAVIPGEGSYNYVEYAALHKATQSYGLAQAYLEYLLSPSAQKSMIYKLGLLPANTKTELPLSFSRLPLYSHSTNDRLDKASILANEESWLWFWDDLLSFRIN